MRVFQIIQFDPSAASFGRIECVEVVVDSMTPRLTAAKDDDDPGFEFEPEYDMTACLTHKNHTVEIAMASAPNADVTDDDLKSLPEAMSCSDWPEWKKAMDEELVL